MKSQETLNWLTCSIKIPLSYGLTQPYQLFEFVMKQQVAMKQQAGVLLLSSATGTIPTPRGTPRPVRSFSCHVLRVVTCGFCKKIPHPLISFNSIACHNVRRPSICMLRSSEHWRWFRSEQKHLLSHSYYSLCTQRRPVPQSTEE